MKAEAMLLVDHRKREVMKVDALLKNRMCADKKTNLTGVKLFQSLFPFTPALTASQNGNMNSRCSGKRSDAIEMLACENLRRRHNRRLPARFDHCCCRHERDNGFSVTDI